MLDTAPPIKSDLLALPDDSLVQIIGPQKILDGGSSGFRLRFANGKVYSLKIVDMGVVRFGSWEESRWSRGYRSEISEYGNWQNTALIGLDSPLALRLSSLVGQFRDRMANEDVTWYTDWIIAKMSRRTFDQAPGIAWGHRPPLTLRAPNTSLEPTAVSRSDSRES